MSKITLENVWDVDGPIWKGNLSKDIYAHCCYKDYTLLKYSPELAWGVFKYGLNMLDLENTKTSFCKFMREMSEEQLKQYIEEYIFNNYRQKVTESYLDLRKEDDIWLTCTPEFIVKVLAEYLNINHCFGSKVNPKTGLLENDTNYNYGIRKKERLLKEFPDMRIIKNYYTNTPKKEMAVMELAENVYCFKGSNTPIQIKKDGILLDKPVILCKK